MFDCFKTKGHEYAYCLFSYSGSKLFIRLGVNWKHYKNKTESQKLVDLIRATLKRDLVGEDQHQIPHLLPLLDDVFNELTQD